MKRFRKITWLPVILLITMSAGCAFPWETLDQLLGNPQSRPSLDVQLSPPPEILPVESGQTGAETGSDELGQDPASETPVQPSDDDATATISPTPSNTHTLLPGTQPITPTATLTPSQTSTVTPSPTSTQTQPAGTQPLIPTSTSTATPIFTPTHTSTPTATETAQGSPPPPPTATDTAQPTSPPACDPSGNGSFESALIALINQERQDRGIGSLSPQGQLATAGRNHSADMACNGFFSHTGSDGSLPWDRVSALGYSYSSIAENIFAGSSNAQTAFNAWLNSPGHRDNMLNPTYTEIGIGYRYWADSPYGAYTTAVFANPR